jgi:hypothetical protein
MPKRNDGNEQDLRVRPTLDAKPLEADNPFTGAKPPDKGPCDEHGTQIDLPAQPPCGTGGGVVTTPSGVTPVGFDWTDPSDVCPRGFDNQTVDKLFMRILKNHFSRTDCRFYEVTKQFVYSDDPKVSTIRIAMNTTFDMASAGQMPAIVVRRGRQEFKRVAMGDRNESIPQDGASRGYSRFQTGSHRLICVSSANGFVEQFAYEVFDLMNAVSPVVRTDLPMHDFQAAGISEVGILDENGSAYGVSIDVAYTFEYSWTTQYIAPTLAGGRVALAASLLEVNP